MEKLSLILQGGLGTLPECCRNIIGTAWALFLWYDIGMSDIFRSCLGFAGILLVGLAGVFVSEMMKLGDTSALIVTVDNITSVR